MTDYDIWIIIKYKMQKIKFQKCPTLPTFTLMVMKNSRDDQSFTLKNKLALFERMSFSCGLCVISIYKIMKFSYLLNNSQYLLIPRRLPFLYNPTQTQLLYLLSCVIYIMPSCLNLLPICPSPLMKVRWSWFTKVPMWH